MKQSLRWIVLLSVVIALASLLWGLHCWRSERLERRRLDFVYELIRVGRATEAVALARSVSDQVSEPDRWREAEVAALVAAARIFDLRQVFYSTPRFIESSETASLLVARALHTMGDAEGYAKLRDAWEGRRTRDSEWRFLDADISMREGDHQSAAETLNAIAVNAPNDSYRLTRLALLTADQPAEAWRFLEQAYKADPRNPTVRSFRAQTLEAAGRTAEARVEYVAAHLADPSNAGLLDQLAEFYIRQGDYASAMDSWTQVGTQQTTDFIELKRGFWRRVALPSEPARPCAIGLWTKLVDMLIAIPGSEFWDEHKAAELETLGLPIEMRQEVFWLRLLQLLKDNREEDAWQLLKEDSVTAHCYSNDIKRALKLTLNYRLAGHLDLDRRVRQRTEEVVDRHQFFQQLDELHFRERKQRESLVVSSELRALLRGDDIWGAIFMAGGWVEAAVRLSGNRPLDATAPDWVAYGMAQAHRLARGSDAALAYAQVQPPSKLLNLLVGEIRLTRSEGEAAVKLLGPLAANNSDEGYRAAWLLATDALAAGRSHEAKAWLDQNPRLVSSTLGQELLARIALLEDDERRVREIYQSIQADSIEAQAYLVQDAFDAEDWELAERLTRQLLDKIPDSLQLRANLQTILSKTWGQP